MLLMKEDNHDRLWKEFNHKTDLRLVAFFLELERWVSVNYGKDWTITCLWRSDEENAAVGGIPLSAHLDLPIRAGDSRSRHFTPEEIQGILKHVADTWFKPGGFIHFVYEGDHFHANINKAYRI
jgi:hypothetical protein